jgi:hypothetical protein
MPDYSLLPLSRIEQKRKNTPAGFEEHEGNSHESPEHKAHGEHTSNSRANIFGGLS